MYNLKMSCQRFIVLKDFSTNSTFHFFLCDMHSLYMCFGMPAFFESFPTKLAIVDLDTLIIVVDGHVASKICQLWNKHYIINKLSEIIWLNLWLCGIQLVNIFYFIPNQNYIHGFDSMVNIQDVIILKVRNPKPKQTIKLK